MKNMRIKVGVVVVSLACSGSVAWAACGGTEAIVSAAIATAGTKIVTEIGIITSALIAADVIESQQIVSSLRVATKQIQASSDKYINTVIASEKAMQSVNKEIADKELIDKVIIDFTSQGYNPCAQSAATKDLAKTETMMIKGLPDRMQKEVDAVGDRYGSVGDVLKNRDSLHQRLFCTQEEKNAGVCSSVGSVPGGDSNAALIFSTSKSPDVVAAKNAVINNIVGLPDPMLSPSTVNTPEGQAYILEKKKKDAYLSFAAYSLKSIQAENEDFSQKMNDRIGQFFGTDKAVEWAKDQAGQASRGVLVDLLKIQGLQLKIHERQIRQNLRTEANVAALLQLENEQINGVQTRGAEKQVADMTRTSKVK